MEYRNLGQAGVKVSAVGVGCNQFGGKVDREGAKAIVHHALDLGVNFFDTADVYGNRGGSEEFLGGRWPGSGIAWCWPPSFARRWARGRTSWAHPAILPARGRLSHGQVPARRAAASRHARRAQPVCAEVSQPPEL
jgi:hypothetical protein